MAQLHDVAVRFDDFIRVRRPEHDQARNGAQRDQLLNRLMGRSIFPIAHGIMGENENRRQFHERREPNGRPCVVAEDEERRSKGTQLRERQAVDDRRHRVLADAEMNIAAFGRARLEFPGTGEFERRPV